MSLKKLNKFLNFDYEGFAKDKKLICIGQQEWRVFETKSLEGTKLEIAIVQDKTDYGEEGVNNLYEKFYVKIPQVINVPVNAEVKFKNAQATVYGEFRNQLSVIAESVEVIGK